MTVDSGESSDRRGALKSRVKTWGVDRRSKEGAAFDIHFYYVFFISIYINTTRD